VEQEKEVKVKDPTHTEKIQVSSIRKPIKQKPGAVKRRKRTLITEVVIRRESPKHK